MNHLWTISFAAGLLLGVLVGWFWRTALMGRRRTRSLLEDALKYLYDREYQNAAATIEGLAGVLAVSVDRATQLVTRLEADHLVRLDESRPRLTDQGRQYALRMIRIHRLWEHFLAERTGLDEREWHGEADQREHRITSDEADRLAADMGDPRFDPHGDPIPTADGEVPPSRGVTLNSLAAGDRGIIVHVEDEPAGVYAELLAQGFSRGMRLRVILAEAERVRIDVEGRQCALSPLAAANLTVEKLDEPQVTEPGAQRLSDIRLGQRATVLGILPACRGDQRRRLLDLGLVPGTVVEAELRSPGGDPTAYRIRGALIALRHGQTDLVRVRPEPSLAETSP